MFILIMLMEDIESTKIESILFKTEHFPIREIT
jgi:hypothetical protein